MVAAFSTQLCTVFQTSRSAGWFVNVNLLIPVSYGTSRACANLASTLSRERLDLSRTISNDAPIVQQGPTPTYKDHYAPLLAKFEGPVEIQDAQSRVHDSLKPKWTWPAFFPLGLNILWWILEFLPMKQWTQDQNGKVRPIEFSS